MSTSEFEQRPWGSFLTYEDDHKDRYWVKKLTVNSGQALSLQKHTSRDEFWVCVEGVLTVQLDDRQLELKAGDSITIKAQQAHRASNMTKADVVFIEVATGQCLESDNIRLEDVYGRD